MPHPKGNGYGTADLELMPAVVAQIELLQALCAATADFLEQPALQRLVVQGRWMTRAEVAEAIHLAVRA